MTLTLTMSFKILSMVRCQITGTEAIPNMNLVAFFELIVENIVIPDIPENKSSSFDRGHSPIIKLLLTVML